MVLSLSVTLYLKLFPIIISKNDTIIFIYCFKPSKESLPIITGITLKVINSKDNNDK